MYPQSQVQMDVTVPQACAWSNTLTQRQPLWLSFIRHCCAHLKLARYWCHLIVQESTPECQPGHSGSSGDKMRLNKQHGWMGDTEAHHGMKGSKYSVGRGPADSWPRPAVVATLPHCEQGHVCLLASRVSTGLARGDAQPG